jgi:hypothetical protein
MALAPDKRRVFLDTNVIFSGLYSGKGAPNAILSAFIRGEITVVISRQVLEELVRNVSEKLPSVLPALRIMLVNAPPEITPDPSLEAMGRSTRFGRCGGSGGCRVCKGRLFYNR